MNRWATQKAFTIVELLIVVVVIAILAAITIVAYVGIQQRAKESAVQSTLSQFTKKVLAARATSGTETFPATLAEVDVTAPSSVSYSSNPTRKGFCLVVQDGTTSYYTTQASSVPIPGTCVTVDGLVAWWPFNNSVSDLSGNGLDGTPVDLTPAPGQGGVANTAYAFNGTTSQMRCGTEPLLTLTSSVSLSAWINLAAHSNIAGIINYGAGGYWLSVYGTNQPSFYISNGMLSTVQSVPLSTWHHVVGTYTSGERRLYLNGSIVASDTRTGGIGSYGSETCHVGNIKEVSDRYLNGRMDDVRIYDRALTTAEVEALYAAGAQ